MATQIRDGGGSGRLAIVDTQGKLTTRAIGVDQRLHAAAEARYFEATTAQVTLTDDSETPLIYIKNTHTDKVIVIDRVFFDSFESTGGSGSGIIRYYINPTVTGGSTMSHTNTNYGSSVTATATFLQELTTMSGTVWWTGQLSASLSVALEEGRIVIPPGFSHGISIEAPSGNTSFPIAINTAFYQSDKEEID